LVVLSLGGGQSGVISANERSAESAPELGSVEQDEGSVEQDEADARADDLAEVGKARGWTDAQVAQYAEAEAALDTFAEQLSTRDPNAFVGTALPEDPSGRPTAYVKGSAPTDIQDLAARLGIDLVDHQPYSLADNDKRLAEVQAAVAITGATDVAGWADFQDGSRITVVAAGVSRSSLDAALRGLDPTIARDVTATVAPGPIVED
jgi:hypothetical protein